MVDDFHLADDIASKAAITTIAVAMTGSGNSTSNRFNGMPWDRDCNQKWLEQDHIDFVAELLENIKNKYNKKNLYVIGKSNGGTLASVIAGTHPGLIQKVVGMAGGYDMKEWCRYGHNKYSGSYLTDTHVSKNIKGTKFFLQVGDKDKTTASIHVAKTFHNRLQKLGVPSELKIYPGYDHNIEYETDVKDDAASFLNK